VRILLLTHRIPYPPDKGDKIRSFHLLEALSREHDVRLITHADDPRDVAHLAELRRRCRAASVHPRGFWARTLASVGALISGRPLSFARFHAAAAAREVTEALMTDVPDVIVVFSAQPAEYLPSDLSIPVVVDLVDVDSEKWGALAVRSSGLVRWIYAREQRLVAAFERRLAERGFRIALVTEGEAEAFRRKAADAAVTVVPNGVAVAAPSLAARSPGTLVFVGAMDYAPNVEAASLAAREVMPLVLREHPGVRLRIVGRHAGRGVRALQALPGVEVPGEVESVTAELSTATIALIPLRVVRGVPNKLLEAFAHGLPVVTTPMALDAIDARPGEHALAAVGPDGLADAVRSLLRDPALRERLGSAGRRFVLERFRWERFDAAMLDLVKGATAEEART
jgi:polysaccharide biosynthesis protein PslH